jgi:hypothetical protein
VYDLQRATFGVVAFVDVTERLGHAHQHGDGVCPTHRDAELPGALAHLAQVLALDVLQNDVGLAVRVGRRLQHLSDARVLQLGLNPGLVEESREKGRVLHVFAPDDLHDARALSAFDASEGAEVDLAHTPASDWLQ